MSRHPLLRLPTLVLLLSALAACGSSSLGPFQPEITNATDNFQLQATGLTGVSTSATYHWGNTGTSANVNQACAISGGTATLQIFDASGAQVYSADLATNGTAQTATGTSGSWTIVMTLQNMRGNLNFRVQKP